MSAKNHAPDGADAVLPEGTSAERHRRGQPLPVRAIPPLYNEISQISGTASNGNQSYNALQAVLQKRLGNGLEYSVAYTYSKCMTDSSGYYGSWGGQTTPTSPYFQNLYDQKAEWGPCYYDATHVLTSYATYDIPFGRDRKFGKSLNPVVNAVAGDWQVNGILSLHTGFALTTSGRMPPARTRAVRAPTASLRSPSSASRTRPLAAINGSMRPTFGPRSTRHVRHMRRRYGSRSWAAAHLDLSLAKFFNVTETISNWNSEPSPSTSQHADPELAQHRIRQYHGPAARRRGSMATQADPVRFEVPLLTLRVHFSALIDGAARCVRGPLFFVGRFPPRRMRYD